MLSLFIFYYINKTYYTTSNTFLCEIHLYRLYILGTDICHITITQLWIKSAQAVGTCKSHCCF